MTGIASPLKERLTATKDGLLFWHQERSILEVTELVCELLSEAGVSRAELADRLGKTKGHVSQLLDGSKNMTIRTISDLFTVLGFEFHPTAKPIGGQGGSNETPSPKFTYELTSDISDDVSEWEWFSQPSLSADRPRFNDFALAQ